MSKKLIEEITLLDAVSGHEDVVKNYLTKKMTNATSITGDNIGSFIAKYEGKKTGKNIAIVAHMDEVGFVVKSIKENGFIKVATVGGILPNVCVSSQVTLHTRENNKFDGVCLIKAPHSGDKSELTIDGLMFDFGFSSNEQAIEAGIQVGDMITFKTNFSELADNKLMSKAFDNRLGCAVITELDKEFKEIEKGNVYLCATVQEESGLRGAQTILHAIDEQIDYVLVCDVSPIEDAFDDSEGVKVGEGCLLRVKDPRTILDYNELDVIRTLAHDNSIKLQSYFSKGGTDANQLQVQKLGHTTSAICIGGRNLHTASSVISYDDYVGARELIKLYILEKLKG